MEAEKGGDGHGQERRKKVARKTLRRPEKQLPGGGRRGFCRGE